MESESKKENHRLYFLVGRLRSLRGDGRRGVGWRGVGWCGVGLRLIGESVSPRTSSSSSSSPENMGSNWGQTGVCDLAL